MIMFDKRNATVIHNELNGLLREFAAKHGLELKPTAAKFGSFEFQKKLEFKVKSQEAKAANDLDAKFKFQRYANKYGYDYTLFGKVVKVAGVEYKITGINPRSYRRPIQLERVSDKRSMKCNAGFLKMGA